MSKESIEAYHCDAENFAARYESKAFEEIHSKVLNLIPESNALILDIGAGSGRDAAWFANRGHEVVAVEPARGMRDGAKARHPNPRIRWVDDQLPALTTVVRTGQSFDLIWLSAVWMHVSPTDRQRAFRKIASLLQPGGRMMVSLRQGPPPPDRKMYPTHTEEIEKLASSHGLIVTRTIQTTDKLGRTNVTWQTICLQAPDDGLGALPLLRHVIVNDSKSSTYKLALLRVLVRIADSATGLVEEVDEDTISIPLGLVALYWIRAFKPLVERNVPQKPPNRSDTGLGFVRDGFRALRNISPYSLRLGARFSGEEATALFEALRDARQTIHNMPAHYITYPGQGSQVFQTDPRRVHRRSSFTLDAQFLLSFGRLKVPRHLWSAMGRYAVWIEPALLNGWSELMQGYEGDTKLTHDEHLRLLRWLEPEHDTRLVRDLVHTLRQRGRPLNCLWSKQPLRDQFDVDHCLPFAAWPCNDLWNLFPSRPSVNRNKSNKLPSAETLEGARVNIIDWWQSVFMEEENLTARFASEAIAALPGITSSSATPSPEAVFEGLMMQRATLKRDQQLEEWDL